MHEISYFDYDYELSTKSISADLERIAAKHSDAGGLYNGIQFKSSLTPFENREKAYEYIQKIDTDYANICVPYLDYPNLKYDKSKLKDMESKLNELQREYYGRCDRQYYTTETVKSAYLGCKNCGSRLAVKYLRGNNCPLCRAEMRPDTELNKIKALKEKYDKAFNAFVSARDKEEDKAKKNCKPKKMWLCKIEYHC